MRSTTGDTKVFPSPAPSVGAAAAGAGAGASSFAAGAGSGSGSGAFSSSAGAASGSSAAGAGASAPAGAITASFVPTSTVSPSWTRICCTTPSLGLGTSVSTLSVEISSSDSSTAEVVAIRLSLILRELFQALDDVLDLRDVGLLERGREGNGSVGRSDAL